MSVLQKLKALFGLTNETDGLEALQRLLEERQASLLLEAKFTRPSMDYQGEPTATFQSTLYYDGEPYGLHTKEFPIPDNGLDDADSNLVQFIASATGVDAEDVSFADLAGVEGVEASATLKSNGEVEVEV